MPSEVIEVKDIAEPSVIGILKYNFTVHVSMLADKHSG
jgi:hypothetical protein